MKPQHKTNTPYIKLINKNSYKKNEITFISCDGRNHCKNNP